MATYRYRAKKGPTELVEGTIEAGSEKEAVERMSQAGLVPVGMELQSQARQQTVRVSSRLRVGGRQVTVFSRQLASLLKAGVPILKALSIISEQCQDQSLRQVLVTIRSEVEDGSAFSTVLEKFPSVFPPLYVAMVKAGEDSGALPQMLLEIAAYRLKQEEMISRVRMAMAYPLLMALVGVGTIAFMFVFVLPRLTRLYLDMGQSLPLPTKILLAASSAAQHISPLGVAAAALVLLALARYAGTRPGRTALGLFQLQLPLFGAVALKAELARFSRTLELLLHSGIPILRALRIALPVVGNETLRGELSLSYRELEQGGQFGTSIKNSKFIPLFMSNLVIIGEETGKLEAALSEVADSYERETDEAIRIMGNLLEPLLILVMGAVVGFMVVAMLLPIFEINVMVH